MFYERIEMIPFLKRRKRKAEKYPFLKDRNNYYLLMFNVKCGKITLLFSSFTKEMEVW
jgi:hypothetical protein